MLEDFTTISHIFIDLIVAFLLMKIAHSIIDFIYN